MKKTDEKLVFKKDFTLNGESNLGFLKSKSIHYKK